MKEYRIFSFYSKDIRIDYNAFTYTADMFIKKFDLPKPRSQMYNFKILYNSEKYRIMKSLGAEADKYNIEIREHTYKLEYSKNDIEKAIFFELKLPIYGSEDYTESFQTAFNDFYCESCDTHQYIPKGEVYINKSEFRGKNIATSMNFNNEIIVSDKMKELIEDAKFTGIVFYPAHHFSGRLRNDYPAWRMSVTSIMPPISSAMPVSIIEGYCSVCKRHHILPLSYVRYKRNELEKASDFNLSCETFGPGWYGSPKLIISRRVYDMLKCKNRGCRFEIVGVE